MSRTGVRRRRLAVLGTAAVVVGSSIVMTVHRGPTVFGLHMFDLLGLFGYVLAIFNSLWIILSIWRSSRK